MRHMAGVGARLSLCAYAHAMCGARVGMHMRYRACVCECMVVRARACVRARTFASVHVCARACTQVRAHVVLTRIDAEARWFPMRLGVLYPRLGARPTRAQHDAR